MNMVLKWYNRVILMLNVNVEVILKIIVDVVI